MYRKKFQVFWVFGGILVLGLFAGALAASAEDAKQTVQLAVQTELFALALFRRRPEGQEQRYAMGGANCEWRFVSGFGK